MEHFVDVDVALKFIVKEFTISQTDIIEVESSPFEHNKLKLG